jgi:hypothetical protein
MGGLELVIRELCSGPFLGAYGCIRSNDQTGEALMRIRLFDAVVMAVSLTAAGCSSDSDYSPDVSDTSATSNSVATVTSETTAAVATTSSTTQPADAGASTLTFTGTECVQSGPTEVGSFVQFALRNEASADVVMVFLQIADVTLEELASDNVERFPPIDQWPPTFGDHPPELVSTKLVDSGEDEKLALSFNEPGSYGSVCWPLDGSPAIPGGLLTVEG